MTNNEFAHRIGRIVIVAILRVPAILIRGYVLSVLWRWFAAPAFGLPELSAAMAYGVAGIAMLATNMPSVTDLKDDSDKALALRLSFTYTYPLLALLYGWLVKIWWL